MEINHSIFGVSHYWYGCFIFATVAATFTIGVFVFFTFDMMVIQYIRLLLRLFELVLGCAIIIVQQFALFG